MIARHSFVTQSETDTREQARAFAASINSACAVALSGDLGAGKTAWVRGMCEEYGCADQVNSPTFTLVNEYSGTRRVLHCDVYRIDSLDDMFEAGLDEMFTDDAIVLVEWAEKMAALLPFPRVEILFEHGGEEGERRITLALVEQADESLLPAAERVQ